MGFTTVYNPQNIPSLESFYRLESTLQRFTRFQLTNIQLVFHDFACIYCVDQTECISWAISAPASPKVLSIIG